MELRHGSVVLYLLFCVSVASSFRSATLHLPPGLVAPRLRRSPFGVSDESAMARPQSRLLAKRKKNTADEEEPGVKPLSAAQRKTLQETVSDFATFEAALRLFVERNGHARVSPRYKMPEDEDVPEDIRSFKLGMRLQNLLKGKYLLREEHPDKLATLSDLGVDVDDEMTEWDRIILSLKAYKDVVGNTKMPARFVVPADKKWPKDLWGFRVGPKLTAIRMYGWYIRENEERMRQLDELGFEWRKMDDESKAEPFEVVFEALQWYKKTNGDLAVPPNFIVPNDANWPSQLVGLPLGRRVASIRATDLYVQDNRDRVQKLSDLGFIWSTREQNVDKRFKLALEAITKYKELYGDADVPQYFKVPRDPSWPEHLWDMQLGNRVNSIRSHGTFVRNRPDRKIQLDLIGFAWDPTRKTRAKGRVVSDEARGEESAPAMATKGGMEEQLPNVDVMEKITREHPVEEPPKELNISEMADPLQDGKPVEGYKWAYDEFGGGWSWDQIVDALGIYVELTGDARVDNVPEDFIVGGLEAIKSARPAQPFPDVCIPRRRYAEQHARHLKSWLEEQEETEYDLDDPLTKLEFRKSNRESSPEIEALLAQEEFEKNDRLVPFHSMPLGVLVKRMKCGEILVRESEQRLDDLRGRGVDFAFDDDAYLGMPYNLLVSGLLIFRKVRGTCCVPHDFVIPDSRPWPYPVRGVKLGLLTNQIRLRKRVIHKHHPEKWQTLFELEFDWLPGRVPPGQEATKSVSEYFVEKTAEGDESVSINSVLARSDERYKKQKEEQLREVEAMWSMSESFPSNTPL